MNRKHILTQENASNLKAEHREATIMLQPDYSAENIVGVGAKDESLS
jgi:hypothetical protein